MLSYQFNVHWRLQPNNYPSTCILWILMLLALCKHSMSQSACIDPQPLGMESGEILDDQITASTEYTLYPANNGRLNQPNWWSAQSSVRDPWIQVEFYSAVTVTEVRSQGSGSLSYGAWVKLVEIQVGDTVLTLAYIMDGERRKAYTANSDIDTVGPINFHVPITTRILRINPIDCNNYCAMRFEIVGCYIVNECIADDPCDENAICSDFGDGFKCTCKPGYNGNGFLCEEDITSLPTSMLTTVPDSFIVVNTENKNTDSSTIAAATIDISVNKDITKKVTIGASIGGVVLLGLVLLTVSVYFVLRNKRNVATEAKSSDIQLESTSNNAHLNPIMTDSTNPLQTEDQAVRTPNDHDETANLQPQCTTVPSDEYGEYEQVLDVNLAEETPYMDLDANTRQPDSVYQEATNPENLTQPDTYLALDPKSQVATCTYQPLNLDKNVPEEIKHTYLSFAASLMNKSESHSLKGFATTSDVDRDQVEEETTSRPIYVNSAVVKQRQKRH